MPHYVLIHKQTTFHCLHLACGRQKRSRSGCDVHTCPLSLSLGPSHPKVQTTIFAPIAFSTAIWAIACAFPPALALRRLLAFCHISDLRKGRKVWFAEMLKPFHTLESPVALVGTFIGPTKEFPFQYTELASWAATSHSEETHTSFPNLLLQS